MVVLAFGELAHAAYRVDAVEEGGELDGTLERAVGAFPVGQTRQCGIHFFVR